MEVTAAFASTRRRTGLVDAAGLGVNHRPALAPIGVDHDGMEVTAAFASTRRQIGVVDAAGLGCALGQGIPARASRQPGGPSLTPILAIAGWTSLLTFGLYAAGPRWGDSPFPVGRLLLRAVVRKPADRTRDADRTKSVDGTRSVEPRRSSCERIADTTWRGPASFTGG